MTKKPLKDSLNSSSSNLSIAPMATIMEGEMLTSDIGEPSGQGSMEHIQMKNCDLQLSSMSALTEQKTVDDKTHSVMDFDSFENFSKKNSKQPTDLDMIAAHRFYNQLIQNETKDELESQSYSSEAALLENGSMAQQFGQGIENSNQIMAETEMVKREDSETDKDEPRSHSVIDLTTHITASRTSSTDSSQSECSNSLEVLPKTIKQLSHPHTSNNSLPESPLTKDFGNFCNPSANHSKSEMKCGSNLTPDETPLVFSPSPPSSPSSSSCCNLSNYRWIKSQSICSTDADTILPVTFDNKVLQSSCFADSTEELCYNGVFKSSSDALPHASVGDDQAQSHTPSITNAEEEESERNLIPSTQNDDNDEEMKSSSIFSLLSVLADLEEMGSDESKNSLDYSKTCSGAPFKNNFSSMYSGILTLPAGPAVAIRRGLKKSNSLTQGQSTKK